MTNFENAKKSLKEWIKNALFYRGTELKLKSSDPNRFSFVERIDDSGDWYEDDDGCEVRYRYRYIEIEGLTEDEFERLDAWWEIVRESVHEKERKWIFNHADEDLPDSIYDKEFQAADEEITRMEEERRRMEEERRRIKIEIAAEMIDEMRLFNEYIAEEARKNGFEVRTVNLKDL